MLEEINSRSMYWHSFSRLPKIEQPIRPRANWHAFEYHPVWFDTLPSALREFCDDPVNRDLLRTAYGNDEFPTYRIAWRMNSIPFAISLTQW